MAKTIQIEGYQCEFCGKEYKTRKGIQNHEKSCTKKEKANFANEIEKIRVTATFPWSLNPVTSGILA